PWSPSHDRKEAEMPGDALWKLAKDRRVKVRVTAAQAPEADLELLELLAADSSTAVRRAVAARKDPEIADLLRALRGDPDLKTREAVVGNPHCPPDVLREFVGDPHWRIRWSTPDHPQADIGV